MLAGSATDTDVPVGTFDLAIGHVPFAQAPVGERRYGVTGHSLHNGCISSAGGGSPRTVRSSLPRPSARAACSTGRTERVDVYLDRRPYASLDLVDGPAEVTVPGTASARSVRVEGFQEGRLVSSRTEQLG